MAVTGTSQLFNLTHKCWLEDHGTHGSISNEDSTTKESHHRVHAHGAELSPGAFPSSEDIWNATILTGKTPGLETKFVILLFDGLLG